MNYIYYVLFDRSIYVRVANILLSPYPLKKGIPQGSVVSPTLFLIMFNDHGCLPLLTRLSQFAEYVFLHQSSTI